MRNVNTRTSNIFVFAFTAKHGVFSRDFIYMLHETAGSLFHDINVVYPSVVISRGVARRVEIGTISPSFPLFNYTLPILGNYAGRPAVDFRVTNSKAGAEEYEGIATDDNPRRQMIIRYMQHHNDSRFPRKYPLFAFTAAFTTRIRRRRVVGYAYTLITNSSCIFRVA